MLVAAFVLGAWAWAGGLLPAIFDSGTTSCSWAGQHLVLVAISGGARRRDRHSLGVMLARPGMRRYGDFVLQFLNVGATIPTLALLALSMSVLGIGDSPGDLRPVRRHRAADREQYPGRNPRCAPTT